MNRSKFLLVLSFLTTGGLSYGQSVNTSSQFKTYWYSGKAELSSYSLQQARYGELHDGHAVLIYVTEPFSKDKLVKSDTPTKHDVSVLKLNSTKKFTTGIYPYSMMTSSFLPVNQPKHSLKITTSSQDWCGHSFIELKNKKTFEIDIHSYFENESITNLVIEKQYLEDDVWSIIRINPKKLPIGKINIIPSFFFLRLLHNNVQPYQAIATVTKGEKTSIYRIEYPDLERTLLITFDSRFPYQIKGWQEEYYSGWGENRKKLTTKATLIKSLQLDYWNKHNKDDNSLRKLLGL